MNFIKFIRIAVAITFISTFACKQEADIKETIISTPTIYLPDEVLEELFHDVQMAKVFPDGKTFVDCIAKRDAKDILKDYREQNKEESFDLKAFVLANFDVPEAPLDAYKSDTEMTTSDHITSLWDQLLRQSDTVIMGSTLLPLPKSYIVPGGRFREIYYWDSYFTMLGLKASNRIDVMENMVANFAALIDIYGHIPNGNRSYYLSRSQPPFFTPMVQLLSEVKGEQVLLQYLPQIEKEYQFWMKLGEVAGDSITTLRSIQKDKALVNRYFDNKVIPRQESYREDVETAQHLTSLPEKEKIYLNLRAGAESGWDFSTRWFADKTDIKTIRTIDILPIDLNCLLFNTEKLLGELYVESGQSSKAALMATASLLRQQYINGVMWNDKDGYYSDVLIADEAPTGVASAAMMYPLFFGVADEEKALRTITYFKNNLLKPGGVVSTNNNSGQQWDAPNGWAPQQWVAMKGLVNYADTLTAKTLALRWTKLNEKVFKNTGKMLEKYNVEDLTLTAGGGEYPVQDGFGWTNGVYLAMKEWLDKMQ
jgi:alpha,alpha-trehalase